MHELTKRILNGDKKVIGMAVDYIRDKGFHGTPTQIGLSILEGYVKAKPDPNDIFFWLGVYKVLSNRYDQETTCKLLEQFGKAFNELEKQN